MRVSQKRVRADRGNKQMFKCLQPIGVFEVKRFMSRGISGKKRTKTKGKKKADKKKEK